MKSVVGCVAAGILKDHSVYTFMFRQSKKNVALTALC